MFDNDLYQWEKVNRTLPRGLPATNLYRIIVREDVFRGNQEHFIDLMNDPNVDGVFEQQVRKLIQCVKGRAKLLS